MGLLDGLLNQVKDQVIQTGTNIVKEKASDIAAKEGKKAEAFALKKIAFAYLNKATNGFDNASDEEKERINQMLGKVIDYVITGEGTPLAEDYNYATNLIYKSLGKPETACSTEVDVALEEFKVALKELQEKAKENENAN